MRPRLIRWDSTQLRAITAAVLFCAVALAVALSSAPQLHELLHKVGTTPNHECAATLMSSGSVEHSDCEPVEVAPQPGPSLPVYRPQFLSPVLAFLDFTRLEHAPPAHS